MGPSAQIGFHAAYIVENGQAVEFGVGNALIGAYLSRLGLSDQAIVYITVAPPDSIQWLKIDDAQALGIDVVLKTFSPDKPSSQIDRPIEPDPSAAASMRPPTVKPTPSQDINDIARNFVSAYFEHWSAPNAEALQYFRSVYAATIKFDNREIARDALLEAKRKFADRWPNRIYVAEPSSVETNCDQTSRRCQIVGIVEWDCRDPHTGAKSLGRAKFTLLVTISPNNPLQVDGEWSSIITK